MRVRVLLPLVVGASLFGVAASTPAGFATTAAPAAADPATPGFGVPRIVDPVHVYGEPDIAVNPKTGAVHASGPQGTGTQRSIYNISVDGGDSYRIVQNLGLVGTYPSGTVPTKSLVAPGGGDTEVQVAHDGRAFFNDLAALACFSAVTTTDDGATTSVANPAACSDPGADRQWIALFDPQPSDATISPYTGAKPLAYMEYQGQATGADIVDVSTDGVNYSHKAGQFADDGVHSPNHTPIIVDQHTGQVLGMTGGATGNSLALAVGEPNAAGDLTYHYSPVAENLGGDPQTLFPILTEDTARNLYAVWVDHTSYQVFYSWSPVNSAGTDWTGWSTPRVISAPPAAVNVFPWAQAAAPGILDVAWYGTDQTLAQLGSSGPSAKKNQAWQLFFNQVTAANSAAPALHQVIAAPHPMHYNDICLLGTACVAGQGNRNQADFFKLVVSPADGRARIIYTDSSNRLSQTLGMDTAADHQGAALDTVVTQETGLNAYTGAPLVARETTAPTGALNDPAGDAKFKPLGGTNVPAADVTHLSAAVQGSNLVLTMRTAGGPLGEAATAAATPFAQLVVRWQLGDTLYHAGVEQPAGGATTSYYAGKTTSVDLCSVSGCKPNYLDYQAGAPNGQPVPGVMTTDAGETTYRLTVPLTAIGNPKGADVLEELSAFVTVSPRSASVPLDNAGAFADSVPLQIEGTKTINVSAADTMTQGPGTPMPEAPHALLLLAVAIAVAAIVLQRRRRRFIH